MPRKHSGLGKESVKVLPRLQSVPSSIGEVSIVRLESTVEQTPMQTWLRIQAQSLMGYTPTLDEAELLWQFVDINTREPHVVLTRRGRHFFTAAAAAKAEASARVKRFFPTEPMDADTGDGWHFSDDPRLVTVHARLFGRYLRQLHKEPTK